MNSHELIIQGADVSTIGLKALGKLTGSSKIERIDGVSHEAFRLWGANPASRAQVASVCTSLRLDFAFIKSERRLTDFGLLAMDMDSTLITIECIDEIADFAGKKAEVAAITASAMRGEINWPESLRRRVSLLAGLEESILQQVYEYRLILSPGAQILIAAAKKAGLKILLVSGGFTFFTERLRERLGLDYAFSNTLKISEGRLTGRITGPLCDADGKARHVREIGLLLGLTREKIIVIGDGANDLKMMAEAGLSVAYHAKPIVQAQANVALNYVGLDGVLPLLAGY